MCLVRGGGRPPSGPQGPQAPQQLSPEQLAQIQDMLSPEQKQQLGLGVDPAVAPDAAIAQPDITTTDVQPDLVQPLPTEQFYDEQNQLLDPQTPEGQQAIQQRVAGEQIAQETRATEGVVGLPESLDLSLIHISEPTRPY